MGMLPPNVGPKILRLQQDLIQNYLMDAINGAWAAGGFVDGGFDAFNADTIGATSTGETYDAGGKRYGNAGILALYTPTGAVFGDMTAYSGLASAFDGVTNQAGASSAAKSGATGYLGKAFSSPQLVRQIKVYAPNNTGITYGGVNAVVTMYGKSSLPSSPTDGTLMGTVTVADSVTAVATVTYAGLASYQYVWAYITYTGGSPLFMMCAELQYIVGGVAPNMILTSSALAPAPAVAPGVARLMVLWTGLDPSAINTDFIAEASRDGGSTWTAGLLADTGMTVAGYAVLWGEVILAAQPMGTAVKYRLRSINGKSQQVKAVGVMVK